MKNNGDLVFYKNKDGKIMWFNKNWSIKINTKNFMKGATPNIGKIIYSPKYNVEQHKNEIETAMWLKRTFGGNILLVQETGKDNNVSSPDFLWNGCWWKLKGTSSLNSINKRLEDAITQLNKNQKAKAGGVILDVTNTGNKKKEIIAIAKRRLSESVKTEISVIIKDNQKLVGVLTAIKK